MRSVGEYFADYETNHRDWRNKAIHGVGIPLIALALLGLLARVPLFTVAGLRVDLAMVLAAAFTVFYLSWSIALALGFALLMALLYLVAVRMPFPWLPALLALGVALQYLGHFIEGRQPAFHRNVVHTLVGPLWIVSRSLRTLGLWRPGAADDD